MDSVRRRVALITVSPLLMVGVACGTQAVETSIPPVGAPAESTTTTTTTSPSTTTTQVSSTTLPGLPVDGVIAGTVAHNAGIAWNETFAIRTLPGDDQPVAASLPPLTELVMTGNARDIDQGSFFITWAEVTAGSTTGWISKWDLVYLGAPRDLTADAVTAFGGLPTAPTMLELGTIVMGELAPVDPESAGAELVRATEPSAGPTSEVVYDAFPGEKFGDDTAIGSRFRVIARQVPVGGLPETAFRSSLEFELVSVEASSLCTRGADAATGWCV